MKKSDRRLLNEIIIKIAAPVLFVALIILTTLTIYTINRNNSAADSMEFDLARITSGTRNAEIDAATYLVPEFIGITSNGGRYGISSSYNIVSELYRMLLPTIYSALAESMPLQDSKWDEYVSAESSVYIRYHSELPDGIITLFAEAYLGNTDPEADITPKFESNVREIFIIPYSSEPYETAVVTRDMNGEVRRYLIPSHKSATAVTINELEKFVNSYAFNMYAFRFNEGKYPMAAYTEPIFIDTINTRNIIVTGDTAALIQNSAYERETLLRIFGFNPDKILNTHIEEDGSSSYYDVQGILYLRESEFEYVKATSDSGIRFSDIIGGSGEAALVDYIETALTLFEQISDINRYYTGGDADIILKSISSHDGEVTLCFVYAADNIIIADEKDAYTVVFSNGVIQRVNLNTIAVRILGDRVKAYNEWWFASMLDKYSYNIKMVYRSDYISESIAAEWAAEVLESQSPDDAELPDLNSGEDMGNGK